MVMGSRDIDEQLLGNGIGHGAVVGDDGASQRRWRKTAGQAQDGDEAGQASECFRTQ